MKTYSFKLIKDGDVVGIYDIDVDSLQKAREGCEGMMDYLKSKNDGEYEIFVFENYWQCVSQTPYFIN